MTKTFMAGAVALLLSGLLVAQSERAPEALFKAAQHTEEVQGDLQSAIEQYRAVVDAGNRELAAEALLRMAGCYQKMGDIESQRIYARIIREFPDQKSAVEVAQTHLAAETHSRDRRAMSLHKFWADGTPEIAGSRGDTEYAISADGRWMSFVGDFNSTLIVRDMAKGLDRALTADPAGRGIYVSTFAKDATAVAFNRCSPDQTTCEIWTAPLDGTGVPASTRVFGSDDVQRIAPKDWSPDGRLLAVSLQRRDRTGQIGFVDVRTGALTVLKSVDWRGPTEVFFSPDGRFIAYDLPASDSEIQRDVFVAAVDGSREFRAVKHPSNDTLMGWTPDGSQLLFASDRSGAISLWAQPIAGGQPQGSPLLVKADIGPVSSMGMTRAGALFLGMRTNDSDIEVATLDLETTGKETAAPARPVPRFTGSNFDPVWSPDGAQLAYESIRGEERLVVVRSSNTGETRELHLNPRLRYLRGLSWSPDGAYFVVSGVDLKGRTGVFRIEAQSGSVSPLVYPHHVEFLSYEGFQWSADGRRLFYHGERGSIYELDLSSGTERVLVAAPERQDPSAPADGSLGPISLSPDGRWIATVRRDVAGQANVVTLLPLTGGPMRDLLKVSDPEWVNNTSIPWLPNGQALLVRKMKDRSGRTSELWRLPINGDEPQKLEFDVSRVAPFAQGRISVRPDGEKLAFVANRNKATTEVWMLENFLPIKASTE